MHVGLQETGCMRWQVACGFGVIKQLGFDKILTLEDAAALICAAAHARAAPHVEEVKEPKGRKLRTQDEFEAIKAQIRDQGRINQPSFMDLVGSIQSVCLGGIRVCWKENLNDNPRDPAAATHDPVACPCGHHCIQHHFIVQDVSPAPAAAARADDGVSGLVSHLATLLQRPINVYEVKLRLLAWSSDWRLYSAIKFGTHLGAVYPEHPELCHSQYLIAPPDCTWNALVAMERIATSTHKNILIYTEEDETAAVLSSFH